MSYTLGGDSSLAVRGQVSSLAVWGLVSSFAVQELSIIPANVCVLISSLVREGSTLLGITGV